MNRETFIAKYGKENTAINCRSIAEVTCFLNLIEYLLGYKFKTSGESMFRAYSKNTCIRICKPNKLVVGRYGYTNIDSYVNKGFKIINFNRNNTTKKYQ